MPDEEEQAAELLSKVADSAKKITQSEESGNPADQKAAWAAHDDMVERARAMGLLDDET